MAQFCVVGETTDGRRFDVGVLAYDERDAAFAARLRCNRGRKGVRIINVERLGA